MKTKIRCGCGLFCADDLREYDAHLQEHVKEDDGNLKLYIDRTSVETVYTEIEIERINEDDAWLNKYTQADPYHGMGQ